jgi:hypothetical protein
VAVKRDEIVRDLAETAAERLAEVVEAAEKRAAEIEADARGEAERIVRAAREEAQQQIDRAQGAVSRLVEQADELRSAIGRLGSDIGERPEAETPAPPEVDPRPPEVPEPAPPLEPEPSPPRIPEPSPPPTPEPTPPETPEPSPPGPQISSGAPSTEDLLAQLRGDAEVRANAGGHAAVPAPRSENGSPAAAGEADVAAARLVAMKMALDGASREEIAAHLDESFSLSSTDELLDDVLARAKS